jgi:hypothetical protein
MSYIGTYRTQSGRNYFRWSFEEQSNGEVRAYILNQPDYHGRAEDGHSTHRYGLSDRPYICYDPMPEDLQDAIEVAKVWADKTEHYIETGTEF